MATMTNAQIIETEKMLRGITSELHTFEGWKSRGFMVKKGEHAAASFSIWKHVKKRSKDSEDGEQGFCMMKKAHFFTAEQVQPLRA